MTAVRICTIGKQNRRRHRCLAALVAVLLSGAEIACSTVTAFMPAAVTQGAAVYPVDRPAFQSVLGTQTYVFGPFTAEAVDREIATTRKHQIGRAEASTREQQFSFSLFGLSRGPWYASCQGKASKRDIGTGSAKASKLSRTLSCAFSDGAETEAAQLETLMGEETQEGGAVGKLTFNDAAVEIAMTKRTERADPARDRPSGYYFMLRGECVGAVDVVGRGIVYLAQDRDTALQFAVSAAAVALLVFES